MNNRRTNTGFRGISQRSDDGRYEAFVNIQGRRVFYKATHTLEEAVKERRDYILSLL